MGTKPPLSNRYGVKYESEYQSSPCVIHSNNLSQIGEFLLCEALGEDVNSLLYRRAILQ